MVHDGPASQPATADRFKNQLGENGEWAVRDDVWIHGLDRKGRLTVEPFLAT